MRRTTPFVSSHLFSSSERPKPTVYAERIVSHFGLEGHFARVYGPRLDDVDGTKTKLIGHALAAERLDAGSVTVVGDRRDDLIGARANEIRFVGVTWGYGSREELEGADYIADSPPDLVSLLRSDTLMEPMEQIDDSSTS